MLINCVCRAVHALTFILNIISETTQQILTKLHRNGADMALFRMIPVKPLVAMATKLKSVENLSRSSCLKSKGLGL